MPLEAKVEKLINIADLNADNVKKLAELVQTLAARIKELENEVGRLKYKKYGN